MTAPLCLPPIRPQAVPGLRLPAGSCDTHIHVFGPEDLYPLAPDRGYTPQPVTLDDYRAVMAALGIDRAVLVQPSVYGTDNRALLDALRREPDRLRGVVVVPPDLPERELRAMHDLGVRGVRINRRNPGGLPLDALAGLGRRLAPLGWHIQLQVELDRSPGLEDLVRASAVPVVLDHLGFADPAAGPGSPAFQDLLTLLDEGRLWVKLSAPYRISRTGPPYADLAPLVGALLARRPDRLLWATDWPHSELWDGMPDTAMLAGWPGFAGEALRRTVLVDNPAALYWG